MIASRRQLLGGVILSLGLSLTKFFPFGLNTDQKTDGKWVLRNIPGVYMWEDWQWWRAVNSPLHGPINMDLLDWMPVGESESLHRKMPDYVN